MVDQEQLPITKPPINRLIRDKTPRREKAAPGSLDRRRNHYPNRQERDQKSRSTHVLKSPPRLEDYTACQNYCCSNPHDGFAYENFHRRHERLDPLRYGSSPLLIEQQRFGDRGSHPDIYGDCSRYRHEIGCCSYHMAPPCCCYTERNYRWTPPPYTKVVKINVLIFLIQ